MNNAKPTTDHCTLITEWHIPHQMPGLCRMADQSCLASQLWDRPRVWRATSAHLVVSGITMRTGNL
eukprot:scaffold388873_cov50-Prasinocladus_malaysianus.AAC.1